MKEAVTSLTGFGRSKRSQFSSLQDPETYTREARTDIKVENGCGKGGLE